jgi:hypothetical protein
MADNIIPDWEELEDEELDLDEDLDEDIDWDDEE